MANDFFQLPPDSTGKRMQAEVLDRVPYDNGTIDFAYGDVVTGATSGRVGTVIHVEGSTASGVLYILNTTAGAGEYSDGEDLQVSAATNATADGVSSEFRTQACHMAGGNDPKNLQYVDNQGQAFVRFGEGALQLDAFGKLQVSEATTLADYISKYDVDLLHFRKTTAGSATLTHISDSQGLLFTTTTGATDSVSYQSHLHHKYQLGKSQLFEFTCAFGDTGKANNRREIIYGDSNDGLGIELNGTTFQFVVRSSTTVSGHVIPQASWNVDKLDGNGLSGITLDVTNDNIYWIDFQWSAGRVRFGVFIAGKRILCHEDDHSNNFGAPYMNSGTQPVCVANVNTGATGSTSELRVRWMTVKTEGRFTPNVKKHFHHIRANEKQNGGRYSKAIANWHPGRALFTIRPKQTINSISNRSVAYPTSLAWSNDGNDSMWVQARRNATLLGTPTWVDFHAESSLQYNEDAEIDMDNRGVQVGMWAIPPNSTINIDLSSTFGYRKERCILDADGTTQDTFQYTFTCWNMSPIAGGSDAGTYTVNVAAASNTITKTSGTDFTTANQDGVAFSTGQIIYLRNSDSDDGYYILTNVTATVLTVENLDGSAVSFTGSSSDVVTIQGGTKSYGFGTINVEEIDP